MASCTFARYAIPSFRVCPWRLDGDEATGDLENGVWGAASAMQAIHEWLHDGEGASVSHMPQGGGGGQALRGPGEGHVSSCVCNQSLGVRRRVMAVVSCQVPCGQVEDVLVSDGPVTWPLSRHMDTHGTQCAYDVHAAVSPVYLSSILCTCPRFCPCAGDRVLFSRRSTEQGLGRDFLPLFLASTRPGTMSGNVRLLPDATGALWMGGPSHASIVFQKTRILTKA